MSPTERSANREETRQGAKPESLENRLRMKRLYGQGVSGHSEIAPLERPKAQGVNRRPRRSLARRRKGYASLKRFRSPRLHILPITRMDKLPALLKGSCRQTIRESSFARPVSIGDWVLFHGWSERPYHSSWPSWAFYSMVEGVVYIQVVEKGFWFLDRPDDLILWTDTRADRLAELDGLIPAKGVELGKALNDMYVLSNKHPLLFNVITTGATRIPWVKGAVGPLRLVRANPILNQVSLDRFRDETKWPICWKCGKGVDLTNAHLNRRTKRRPYGHVYCEQEVHVVGGTAKGEWERRAVRE